MKRRDPDSTTFAPILGDKQAAIGLIERHVLARYGDVLADTATKINAAHQKAQHHAGRAIEAAKEVGAMLLEVKKQLPYGEFLPWVSANCTVSERQARRYMAAALGKPTPVRTIKTDTVSDLAPPSNQWAELRGAVSDLIKAEIANFARWRAIGVMLLELEEQFDASYEEFVEVAAEKLGKPERDIEFCMRLASEFSLMSEGGAA